MLSAAFSDSYLPSVGLSLDPISLGGSGLDDQRLLSPEDHLIPPLTGQMRHPSAPHLATILTTSTSVDRADRDNLIATAADDDVGPYKLW